jgi:hypothetical protein
MLPPDFPGWYLPGIDQGIGGILGNLEQFGDLTDRQNVAVVLEPLGLGRSGHSLLPLRRLGAFLVAPRRLDHGDLADVLDRDVDADLQHGSTCRTGSLKDLTSAQDLADKTITMGAADPVLVIHG